MYKKKEKFMILMVLMLLLKKGCGLCKY